jgi:GH25 family lysozyme M1 (1,4-beta-N-acetylmuramidase)
MTVKRAAVALCVLLALLPGRTAVAAEPEVPGDGGWAGAGQHASVEGPAGRTESDKPTVADFPVTGIDVSSHDHTVAPIDWPAVAASGTAFAYIKATEGRTYTNPYFAADSAAARAAGLLVGAYVFGRPDLGDPVGQARYFVAQSKWTPDTGTLVPFLDVEWPYGALHRPACWGLTPAQMVDWIRGFVTEVTVLIGRRPMIYTNANWWNPCTGSDASFADYPLNIAGYTKNPPKLPAGWSTFAVWQHAAGSNAEAGNYDQDVFNGDLLNLRTLAGPAAPTRSLRAGVNQRFVCAEEAGARPLIANRPAAGRWEQFDLVDIGYGLIALRSRANGRYVTAEDAGRSPLVARALAVSTWERFQLIHNRDGSVSLKAMINGKYVTAENAGRDPLIANRTAIGSWEKFELLGVASPH